MVSGWGRDAAEGWKWLRDPTINLGASGPTRTVTDANMTTVAPRRPIGFAPRPLRLMRISIRKDGKSPNLPWVMRCGCGLRCQTTTWESAAQRARIHFHSNCEDFHP